MRGINPKAQGADPCYDQNGDQTMRVGSGIPGGVQEVAYNDFNMPSQITDGSGRSIRLEYDDAGARVAKHGLQYPFTETTIYAGDLYECVGTTPSETGQFSCEEHRYKVFAGDRQVAMVTRDASGNDPRTYFIQSDQLGSSTTITAADGLVVEKRRFGVFGEPEATFSTDSLRAGFTGHEHDLTLGLINMRGRLYDPQTRRFTTPDPYVTEPFNPQGFNRYSYVQNSPLSYVDPNGFLGIGLPPGVPPQGYTGGGNYGASYAAIPSGDAYAKVAFSGKGSTPTPWTEGRGAQELPYFDIANRVKGFASFDIASAVANSVSTGSGPTAPQGGGGEGRSGGWGGGVGPWGGGSPPWGAGTGQPATPTLTHGAPPSPGSSGGGGSSGPSATANVRAMPQSVGAPGSSWPAGATGSQSSSAPPVGPAARNYLAAGPAAGALIAPEAAAVGAASGVVTTAGGAAVTVITSAGPAVVVVIGVVCVMQLLTADEQIVRAEGDEGESTENAERKARHKAQKQGDTQDLIDKDQEIRRDYPDQPAHKAKQRIRERMWEEALDWIRRRK